MISILKAEHLKLKHTFARRIPVIAPCVILVLALVLTAGISSAFPAGAWNWWYVLFLPGTLSVLCYLDIRKDSKLNYHNILLTDILPQKCWLGKILYCSMGLLVSNFILYSGTLIGGAVFGTTISPISGLLGAVLLTITYLWEVPLFLFFSAKLGLFAGIFVSVVLSVSGVITVADSSLWWIYPPSIPIRLMCPVLGILPNGLPVPAGDGLSGANVILPGILLSAVWFFVFALGTCAWFQRREER